jgi:hypothetical protein
MIRAETSVRGNSHESSTDGVGETVTTTTTTKAARDQKVKDDEKENKG